VWKLPDTWGIPAKGHFESMGPNQYGHTRSFQEGSTRHVIEMQSDLQQHLAPLSEGAIKQIETEITEIGVGLDRLGSVSDVLRNSGRQLRPVLQQWRDIWPAMRFTPRYKVGSWVAEHIGTLNDTALRRLDGAGAIETLEGAEAAIKAAYDLKAGTTQYNSKTKGWEKIESFKIGPRNLSTKTAEGRLRDLQTGDAWQVEMQVRPVDILGSEPQGEPRTVVEPVSHDNVLHMLTEDGWVPHDVLSLVQDVTAKLRQMRDEQSARLGSEPLKAELREKLRPIGEKVWPRRLVQEEIARAGKEGMDKIRFATADTVSRVEGWPRKDEAYAQGLREAIASPRMSETERAMAEKELAALEGHLAAGKEPELRHAGHQSIYDRYAKDVSNYLKQLGAKDVVDQYGHTWHEVATKAGVPPRMFGKADPTHIAKLAAIGVGAAAGAYFSEEDSKLGGALAGAAAATALLVARPGIERVMKDLRSPDTRIRITHLGDDREELIHRLAIDTVNVINSVAKMVPRVADREHLLRWLRGDRSVPLNAEQQKALPVIRKWFQIQGLGGRTAQAAAKRFTESSKNMTDVLGVMGAFGNAVARSVADTRMLDALESTKDPAGNGLIATPNRAPAGYEHIDHPLLQGYLVHPDIKSSLKLLLDTAHPVAAKRIAWTLLIGTKRALVSFSLFHATALSFAHQAASTNPVKFVKLYAQAVAPRIFGENLFLKTVREQGHAAPLINEAIQGGLTWSKGLESAAAVEDVGNFYAGMYDIARLADNVFPTLGMAVRKVIQINQKFDGFMWDRLHAGMKLDIFADKYTKLLENNAKAYAENPGKVKLMSKREAANIAAAYSNAIFGGLNWRRAAESVQSKLLRSTALSAASPLSRRIAQVALFAPDWLVSTATPWFVALFGKGTGIKGVLNAQTLADLHRQYLIRSGLYYLVVGDAINYSMSGHHIWDNKNPLQIDLDSQGERHMIFNKHLLEIPHAIQDPQKQTLGKLSFPVKESLNQLFGTEYLAPHKDPRSGQITAGPPMEGSRIGHTLRGLEPISAQQGLGGGTGQGIAGFFGLPIYGKTHEQRMKEAEERRRKRTRQKIDAILER
jgi:hypothetical protein